MKVAGKVILLLNGGDAFAAAISGSLQPKPSSSLQLLNDLFELPLESYGITDRKASGNIIHFINSNGQYEVSILLLQNYEPPILACALNEILLKLAGEDMSTMPTLIVPFAVSESKLKQENKYTVKSDKVSVYGIKLGPTTDVTQTLSSKLKKPPPSLQIHQEDLAILLHLVNVVKLPAVVLIGQTSQHTSNKASEDELEVVCEIGELLASVSSLTFSKEKMIQNPTKTSRDSKEAWRALYG
ncbi:hypothetical protein BUALT_Bualt03G0224300 [Buddleja alternifolia]|uniref:DUF7894 domain-containing protein n=1 Tax=Buddleja alternifolia TaxID=168488 RepID=A0AAV6Y6U0_9LAMI|nr:hypothetical protein BUALT_Bualt03G0224300 [Buddleja alternifolia]